MVTEVERYVSVDGIRIRYLESGQGPPVVFLHGLGGLAEEWLAVMEGLRPSFRVLAPDLPGYGLSDKPAVRYTSRYFARAIRGLLHALGIPAAFVVGHSLGGGVALEMAVSCPEVCRRLVLLAPAGLSRRVGIPIRVLATPGIGELMVRRRRRPRNAVRGPVDPASPPDILREAKRKARATPGWREATLGTVRASVTPLGLRASLTARAHRHASTIRTPALFIWGDRDRVVPMRDSVWILGQLPGACLEVLPGLGHDLHLQEPEEIARLIRSFLTV